MSKLRKSLVIILAAGLVWIVGGRFPPQLKPASSQACGSTQAIPSGEFRRETRAIFNGEPVAALNEALVPALMAYNQAQVLGEVSGEEKWIEVNLTEQKLRAHEGDSIVYEFPVSSGKFAPTPVGEFRIWSKFKYTKMEGGVKGTGTYYYLPNVPYTMYFYQGYGIHGTYWHNNFGQPMSHGCVNVSIPDAEKLFYWAEPVMDPEVNSWVVGRDQLGTRVVVHGKAPR
ncbi:MAG: L,D-transpeptidase [Candidatus Chisholmbacteria bacterium]|nr:L,D-transpeptidase [Candidatus Chisholmbacteria bacterium]